MRFTRLCTRIRARLFRPKFWLGLVSEENAAAAFHWHQGFAGAECYIAPLEREEFAELAKHLRIVCAKDPRGNYAGLAYFTFKHRRWVLGGLMVHHAWRRNGIAWNIACLTLGHVLFEEDPLARDEEIVAHIKSTNDSPRSLIRKLAFEPTGRKINTARGTFDEFQMTVPQSLRVLANWANRKNKKLVDGTSVQIELRPHISLQVWKEAFIAMANKTP